MAGLLCTNDACRRAHEVHEGATPEGLRCEACGSALEPAPGPGEPTVAGETGDVSGEASRFGRYLDAVAIARGGMGAILRARDPELDRPVAIKILHGGAGADRERHERFLREARILGRLEHPNIPPIHEIGATAAREPYFVMKLVEGRALSEILGEWRRKIARKDWPRDRLRLMGHLLRVADALAYAHSRGIVHRDLKPANVMVGKFGEVLVMDWGIARVLNAECGTRHEESAEVSGNPGWTQDGTILGTPGYMAPEQASGEIDRIDGRTDVYALGAMLYEILTLTPPYAGRDLGDLLSRVVSGRLESPSERAPWAKIPRELDAVVARAMALEPAERYQKVEDLRQDLDLFLEGRTLSALQYTILERGAKWVRRHRGASLAGAIGLAAVLGVGGVLGGQRIAEQREREAELRAREETRTPLESGQRLLEEARVYKTDPAHTHDAIQELARRAIAEFERAREAMPAEACLGIARAHRYLGNDEQAIQALDRAILASPGFATPYLDRASIRLDEYVNLRRRGDLRVLAETPDAAHLRESIEADLRKATELSEERHERVKALGLLAFARGEDAEAEDRLAEYLLLAPGDVAVLHVHGWALYLLERYEEAEAAFAREFHYHCHEWNALLMRGLCRESLGRHEEAIADYDVVISMDPGAVSAYINRSIALQTLGRMDAARADAEEALRLDPESSHAIVNWGTLRKDSGDLEGAVGDFTRAIQLDPELQQAWYERGLARRDLGDLDGALSDFEKAIRLFPASQTYYYRGDLRLQRGDVAGASSDCDRALELDPNDASALNLLARIRLLEGDLEGTILAATRAIEREPGFGAPYGNRGIARMRLERYEEGLADLDRALELDPTLAPAYGCRGWHRKRTGDDEGARADFDACLRLDSGAKEIYVGRAILAVKRGDLPAAIADYDRALAIDPEYAAAYRFRAMSRVRLGDREGAIADFSKSLSIDPDQPDIHYFRALSLEALGRIDPAVADLERALQIAPADWPSRPDVEKKLAELRGR